MDDAPSDETWVILRFPDYLGEPKVEAGFWGGDNDWYGGEAAGQSLVELYGDPVGWLPLDGEG
jgi:hypothetical protein